MPAGVWAHYSVFTDSTPVLLAGVKYSQPIFVTVRTAIDQAVCFRDFSQILWDTKRIGGASRSKNPIWRRKTGSIYKQFVVIGVVDDITGSRLIPEIEMAVAQTESDTMSTYRIAKQNSGRHRQFRWMRALEFCF